MQPSILKKVIDALNEQEPKLDYIRGMLETLYEIEVPKTAGSVSVSSGNPEPSDEASILDAKARAAIDTAKQMAAESQAP